MALQAEDGPQEQTTGAGCVLTAASALITLVVCLVFGGRFFAWAVQAFPLLAKGRLAHLIFGVVVYGVLIAPGLLSHWLGARLLARCGFPIRKPASSNTVSRCRPYHLYVERLADGLAIHPVGRLDREGNWLVDDQLRDMVSQLAESCVYLDCAPMPPLGTEGLGNLMRLWRIVSKRHSRLELCNVQPEQDQFFRIHNRGRYLGFFGIRHGGMPGEMRAPSVMCFPEPTADVIRRLVRTIRDERGLEHMRLLGDMLATAGCDNADILDHCRSNATHGPDCWVLDLLLRT